MTLIQDHIKILSEETQLTHQISIFWFKRDLRLFDNDALYEALKSDVPLLLLYVFEPSLLHHDHYSERHWRFIQESLDDMDVELKTFNTQILRVKEEVVPFFEHLSKIFSVKEVYSTEETGLEITYKRDIAFTSFCKDKNILWNEFQNGGVQRGIKDRSSWQNGWNNYMKRKIKPIVLGKGIYCDDSTLKIITDKKETCFIFKSDHEMQKGGRTSGKLWENSFFDERLQYYSQYISKPEMSRYGCSRLSPYFAWGCISVREVYQRLEKTRKDSPYKKQLSAFSSRLRWQAHFIQKFEMEPRIEFEPFNKGYLLLQQPLNEEFVEAWKNGRTGFPLVDASMRAVAETGYLNFRMRTMSTSFLLHLLFQNFRTGSAWLARQFLDFEPGIHYAQFQMQAGLTATNTLRIYNPTKNAHDHDPEAIFIKKYVPELAVLPANLAIEPWSVTEMEEEMYGFKLGESYPQRIIDIQASRKFALDSLYGMRKLELTQAEKQRILDVHTLERRFP